MKFEKNGAVGGALLTAGIFAVIMVLAPSIAGAKPLNAGKDGFKSNAGVGNGTEAVQVGEPTTVTTYTSSYIDTTTSTSGEPVIVETTVDKSVVNATFLREEQVGRSANFKRYYDVTYKIVTTTATETVVTYETVRETKVFATSITTTDMADVDPGNSQSHNKAPEGEPDDIVVVEGPTEVSSSSEVISSSEETVSGSSSSTSTSTSYNQQVLCNGSEGTNPGTGYCQDL